MMYFWGCSDDCIELSGAMEEEVYGTEGDLVLDNDFTASISYDGDWKIRVTTRGVDWILHEAGSKEAVDITGRDYTDVLAVPSKGVKWAVLGGTKVTA